MIKIVILIFAIASCGKDSEEGNVENIRQDVTKESPKNRNTFSGGLPKGGGNRFRLADKFIDAFKNKNRLRRTCS